MIAFINLSMMMRIQIIDHSTTKNIERIRNGDEVMNLPVVRSEIFFSSEFENENSQLSSYFAN
jgi:hypothetical protein